MTLAKRIIPTLLIRGNQLVKGKKFQSWRSVGVAEQAARIYAQRGVDELVILDISATPAGRGPDFEMIQRMTDGNFCPIGVGGGVSEREQVRNLLNSGADKVIIGTESVSFDLIGECARKFGSQAIVICVDYDSTGVVIQCGTRPTYTSPVEFSKLCAKFGAGEIIIQSIERDGMMQGYDLAMIKAVSDAVDISVIASGGCGSYDDMYEAFKAGADAVAASSLFLFTESTPRGAAEYLISRGIRCRI